VITDPIHLSLNNPRVGQTVTAAFRLRNEIGRAETIPRLQAGARGLNACAHNWDAPLVDFPAVENLTLRPGEEYLYQQSRTFTVAGDYFAEPVMQDTQGRWGGIWPWPRVEMEAMGGGLQLGTVSFPEPPLTCEEIAAGVRHCSNAVYHLLIADLSRPGVSAHVAAAHNWTDPERFQAQTVREMAQDAATKPQCRVVAGINGGYFGPDHHNSEGWTMVKGQVRRDIRAKVRVDPGYPPQHWPSLVIHTPARAAITAGPIFIEQGQALPTVDGALCELRGLPRCYCTDAYGQFVAAVSRDGRTLYLLRAERCPLAEVVRFLLSQKLDVWTAIKLDGGSSAQMVYRSGGALYPLLPG
jgi:hypothetical protein